MTLVVEIPDSETVNAEMSVDSGELGVIAEMATDASRLSTFGFSDSVIQRARSLAEATGDEHPEFPVVRVEEGWSNNHRLWDGDELANLAEQVNELEPVGHWGHVNFENLAWEAPDPQTTWVGALIKDEPSKQKDRLGKTVKVFYAAGYNLPGAKVRTYIKSRAVKGVSWLTRGREIPVPGKGVQIRNAKLIALDWARKCSEGMPTSSIAAIASEQTEGGGMAELQLAAVTPEQFQKENPNGYALIVAAAKAETDQVVAEMEDKIKKAEEDQGLLAKIRDALKLDEGADVLAVIANLMTKVGDMAGDLQKKLLEKEILKRIPGDTDEAKRQRTLVARLLPQAEMVAKVADCKDEESAEKVVGEMVETAFNDDNELKVIIGEMEIPAVRRREELGSGAGGNKNPYVEES